jgi:hypothetical protein
VDRKLKVTGSSENRPCQLTSPAIHSNANRHPTPAHIVTVSRRQKERLHCPNPPHNEHAPHMKLSRPNDGISRIDQPEKHNHGWFVRVSLKGK